VAQELRSRAREETGQSQQSMDRLSPRGRVRRPGLFRALAASEGPRQVGALETTASGCVEGKPTRTIVASVTQ
jgi:hypothetical protein